MSSKGELLYECVDVEERSARVGPLTDFWNEVQIFDVSCGTQRVELERIERLVTEALDSGTVEGLVEAERLTAVAFCQLMEEST